MKPSQVASIFGLDMMERIQVVPAEEGVAPREPPVHLRGKSGGPTLRRVMGGEQRGGD